MDFLSREILAVLLPFSVLFSKPTWKKGITLVLGTLMCTGRRTVCAALRATGLTKDTAFPRYHHNRQIILVGDGGFAAGKLAWDCIRRGVILISRLKMNAQLFDFPPERQPGQRGRTALRGRKLVNFKQMLDMEDLPWQEAEVTGYSGIRRKVRFLSTTCMWGSEGSMPVPIRWVLVVDPSGKMDPLPLMSTDPQITPEQVIELYIERWNLEITFEESREHLGVETQRQWSDKAIARSTPALLGLYSIVCLVANQLGQSKVMEAEKTTWYRKEHLTFSDLLRTVRMILWRDNLFFQKDEMKASGKNVTPEMEEWAEVIVQRLLQAA